MTEAPRLLVAYNSISSSLWSVVLFNTIFLWSALGQPILFEKSSSVLIGVQCLAVIEIFNAATGIVRSPILTTTMQVFSRLLIVLGICRLLPDSPANTHWVYATLCLSWSITEIIRYSYYASNLTGEVAGWLEWLRYSTFYILYPTGVASEVSMIYLSLDTAAANFGDWYKYFLIAILFTYPPGFYMLYTYMIKQRKKVLGKRYQKEKVQDLKKKE